MRIDIASSSLRDLDAVPLATNVTVFVERDTKDKMTIFLENRVPLSMMDATSFIRSLCGEGIK